MPFFEIESLSIFLTRGVFIVAQLDFVVNMQRNMNQASLPN